MYKNGNNIRKNAQRYDKYLVLTRFLFKLVVSFLFTCLTIIFIVNIVGYNIVDVMPSFVTFIMIGFSCVIICIVWFFLYHFWFKLFSLKNISDFQIFNFFFAIFGFISIEGFLSLLFPLQIVTYRFMFLAIHVFIMVWIWANFRFRFLFWFIISILLFNIFSFALMTDSFYYFSLVDQFMQVPMDAGKEEINKVPLIGKNYYSVFETLFLYMLWSVYPTYKQNTRVQFGLIFVQGILPENIVFFIQNSQAIYLITYIFVFVCTYVGSYFFFLNLVVPSYKFFMNRFRFYARIWNLFRIVYYLIFFIFFMLVAPYFVEFLLVYYQTFYEVFMYVRQLFLSYIYEPTIALIYEDYLYLGRRKMRGFRSRGLNVFFWIQFWTQTIILFFNPWFNHCMSYFLDTIFLIDSDKVFSYKRISSWYQFFSTFLRMTENKIPDQFVPPRVLKKTKYIWFEDDRDKYVYWRPVYSYLFGDRKYDYFHSEYYYEGSYEIKQSYGRIFRSHSRVLYEQEIEWRESLYFYYRVGNSAFKNITPAFLASTRIYEPILKLWYREERILPEFIHFDESDELEEHVYDERFNDELLGHSYYYNYKIIKYFDWVNVSNQRFVTEVSDYASFNSKFWYKEFLISQFGKSVVTDKEDRYEVFLDRSYYTYIEDKSTLNFFNNDYINEFSKNEYNAIINTEIKFDNYLYFGLSDAIGSSSKHLYEYFISMSVDSPVTQSLLVGICHNEVQPNRPLVTDLGVFFKKLENFFIHFLIEMLFIDFCKMHGYDYIFDKYSNISDQLTKLDEDDSYFTGVSVVNKFIDFVCFSGYFDTVYVSFMYGLFFPEFFYDFNKFLTFNKFNFNIYLSTIFSHYADFLNKALIYAFEFNNYDFGANFVKIFSNFKDFNTNLISFTVPNFESEANFVHNDLSSFYTPITVNFDTQQFINCSMNNLDTVSSTDEDELSTHQYFNEILNLINISDIRSDGIVSQRCNFLNVNKPVEFYAAMFNKFISCTFDNYCNIRNLSFRALDFNRIFNVSYSPDKLRVDLLSKQLNTIFGIEMLSYDTIPKFDGFFLSDQIYFNGLGNIDSAYFDLNITSSFEEYYNYDFFSDYFGICNINTLMAISTYKLNLNQTLKSIYEGSVFNFDKYFESVLFIPRRWENKSLVRLAIVSKHITGFWALNYRCIFHSAIFNLYFSKFIVMYSHTVHRSMAKLFDTYIILPVTDISHVHVGESRKQVMWYYIYLIRYWIRGVFNRIWVFLDKSFLSFGTFYNKLSNIFFAFKFYVTLPFLVVWNVLTYFGVIRFVRFIFRLIFHFVRFIFRFIFRVLNPRAGGKTNKSILVDQSRLHFYKESEFNFDFNDKVFLFLNESVFFNSTRIDVVGNFSIFSYSFKFFKKIFF